MKIAILGYGRIGSSLGKKWVEAGHTLCFGVRDPQKSQVRELVSSLGSRVSACDIPQAIEASEVVVFAIPGSAMDQTIAIHAGALNGKMIIDTANKMTGPVANSLATFVHLTPEARYFRAFNIYGWENFENPDHHGETADLFYCGPDGEPRTKMEQLIREVGLRPVCLGDTDKVEVVDALLQVWFTLIRAQHLSRHTALKLITS
ncbi:MAG TPA: NAD(P)-binding domain-containing protein [Anaerolineaceae bacterium]|nr:NAD(P)-binding domain-containing protein [Anaerolineaceae bacterium]